MRLLAPAAALLLAALSIGPGSAGDFPAYGGPGDAGFRDQCPEGQGVVGFSTRTGSLMDQIETLCAPMRADGNADKFDAPFPPHGGNGGLARSTYCSGKGKAQFVRNLDYYFSSDARRVAMLSFYCSSPRGGSAEGHCTASDTALTCSSQFAALRTHGMNFKLESRSASCPLGEYVIGVHGRYGKHVNAIGAICGKVEPPFDQAKTRPGDDVLASAKEKPPVRTSDKTKLDPNDNIYTAPAVPAPAPPAPAQPTTPPEQHDTFAGVWDTVTAAGGRYTMKLTQQRRRVSGSYARPDGTGVGTIEGKVRGGTLTYRWKEGGSEGSGRFKLADDGNGFAGWWNSSQQPDDVEDSWNGTRR